MTLEELKNDINFYPWELPNEVSEYINRHATSIKQYVSYAHIIKPSETVVFRMFAFKLESNGKLLWTEVERKIPGLKQSVIKNIYYTSMGGWHPMFKRQASRPTYYYGYAYRYFEKEDYDKWFANDPIGVYVSETLNYDAIFKTDRYKYCSWNTDAGPICEYLAAYDEHHEVEYFGKLHIRYSKKLMDKMLKDKNFCRFVREHADEVKRQNINAVVYAYNHNVSIQFAGDYLCRKADAGRWLNDRYKHLPKQLDALKVQEYIQKNKINRTSYMDFIEAVVFLKLDLKDTKNIFPKEFERMHEVRINEMHSKKAEMDEQARKELYERFSSAADLAKAYEVEDSKYCIIIPSKPSDLIHEGDCLHHCVGKMGYDEKMASGKCIIGFLRLKKEKETPYVTVEYSGGVIRQCYGDYDSKPTEAAMAFAKKWGQMISEKEKEEHERKAVQSRTA